MSNVFDQLSGIHDNPEMGGIFKKLKKAAKKVARKVRKVTSKIGRKVLPSSIRKLGRKIDKSGLGKIAAGVALAFVGGPAIMAGVGKAGGLASKGLSVAKGAIGSVKVGSAAKILGSAGKLTSTAVKAYGGITAAQSAIAQAQGQLPAQASLPQNDVAYQQAMAEAETARALSAAMGSNSFFRDAVAQLRSQGYSDAAILEHWVESRTYYENAVAQATKAVYPQAKLQYEAAGAPPALAADLATAESFQIANQEVQKVQKEVTNKGMSSALLPVGLIAALTLIK